MTITTIVDAMQVINATITGVKTTPTELPGSLETADLPAIIVWPSAGESSQSAGFNMVQRTYLVTGYVMPAEQGLGISEGWAAAKTLLQLTIDEWLKTANVILVTGTYSASVRPDADESPILDAGIEMIAYPPPAQGVAGYPHYFGFQLGVTIKETWAQ